MRSKANFRGHPIHPMLVAFPIAFFSAALAFDILGVLRAPHLHFTAYYLGLAGILTALMAAIPGLMDLLYTVPPRSSARKRGVRHGLINVGVVILFALAQGVRLGSDDPSAGWIIALEGLGFVLMVAAGWMGGTLAYRNQIGVDLRYANAGKWREITLPEEKGTILIRNADDLQEHQMMLIHAGRRRIVLARHLGRMVAFDDRCPHRGGSLAGGSLACGIVQCPWHGSQFDVTDGSLQAGPAEQGITVFPVVRTDQGWELQLGPEPAHAPAGQTRINL